MKYDFSRLLALGIIPEHCIQLRRISMTLNRWHEMECGDSNNYGSWCIVRGKKTGGTIGRPVINFEYDDNGQPFLEHHIHTHPKPTYRPVPDRERGALRRLAAIMTAYSPRLSYFVQTDPRGCALYVGEGKLTDTNYSSLGVAICK